MTELLILFVLLHEKSTIYGIKQKIESLFSSFFIVSFGAIHPALKKINKNGFVTVKAKLSSGGQKSSFYSITDSGIERFKNIMIEDLPKNPSQALQLNHIKLMLLSSIDNELQKIVINKILANLELQKSAIKSILKNTDEIQRKLLNRNLEKLMEDIQWLKTLL